MSASGGAESDNAGSTIPWGVSPDGSTMVRSATSLETGVLASRVCVIGSGPTGQVAARRLARAGLDVVMLEAGGPATPPRTAFQLMASGAQAVGDRYPDLSHTAYAAIGGTSSGPSIGLAQGDPGGVGIRLRPLDPVDLEPRPAAGLAGWPLDFAELRAATEEAARLFGLASLDSGADLEVLPGAERLRSAAFHIADRRSFSDPCFDDVAHLDVVADAPVHHLEADPDGRVRRAHVRTVDGRELVVEAEAFVLAAATASTCRLLLGSTGAGPAGLANSSGLVGRGLMDHPLVTAGWLTPRDGARERLGAFGARLVGGDLVIPKLVARDDLVRADVVSQSWATLVPSARGALEARMASSLRRAGQRTDAMSSLHALLQGVRRGRVPVDLGRKLLSVAAGADDVVIEVLRRRAVRHPAWSLETPFSMSDGGPASAPSLEIVQLVEQLPDDRNRLVLTDCLDPAGRPKAQMHWRWSSEDSRREQAFAAVVRDALRDAGLGEVVAPITRGNRHVKQWSAHHLAGGTRMSASPYDGVVDRHGRSHDHQNLWIAGTSVFPTSGHANPTLSAVATGVIAADDVVGAMAHPVGAPGGRHGGREG
jgi:choline dehydrogenase-like flavoprotein